MPVLPEPIKSRIGHFQIADYVYLRIVVCAWTKQKAKLMLSVSVRLFFPLALLVSTVYSAHAELVIIIHPQNDAQINAKNVKRIFLGKEKKFSNGLETIPINQTTGSPAREAFDNNQLGRSSTQISAYWSKLVFTGKGVPPKEVLDDAAVISLVVNNKNAIGYIDSSKVNSDIKVIKIQ